MSPSQNFPTQASPSYEGPEPQAEPSWALQFSSWNQADNTNNMYVKKSQIIGPNKEPQSNSSILW